jgi:hypothetical protein
MSDRTRLSRPNRFTPTLISLEDRAVPADLGSLNDSLVVLDPGPGIDPARAHVTGTLVGDGGGPVADGIVDEAEDNHPTEPVELGDYGFAQSLEQDDEGEIGWIVTDDGTVPFDFDLERALPHVTVRGNWDAATDNQTHDYYTLEVPDGGGQLWVNTDRFFPELQMYVFDENGNIALHNELGQPIALQFNTFYALAGGTYTLAVGAEQSNPPAAGLLSPDGDPVLGAYELYVAVDTHDFVEGGSFASFSSGEGSDTYSLTLGAGEHTSLAVAGADAGLRVEVLDADGVVVASGPSVASFAAPAAGTFTVKVSGLGDYELLVGVNTTADAEPNDTQAEAQEVLTQRVHRRQWATGTVGAGDADFYRVDAEGRSTLRFASVRPAGAEGDWVRPRIRVFNEAGQLVASNAGDRNQELTYRVPRNGGGAYFVEVSAPNADTAREYAVSIRGANSAAGSIAWESLVGEATADWLDNNPAIERILRDVYAWLGVQVD